jgi:hypothetical protein
VEGQPPVPFLAKFFRQGGHLFDYLVNAHERPPRVIGAARELNGQVNK